MESRINEKAIVFYLFIHDCKNSQSNLRTYQRKVILLTAKALSLLSFLLQVRPPDYPGNMNV